MATILIVDDETNTRVLLNSILENELGHELFFAPDGAAAIEMYPRIDPDLVITDLVMSRLNGVRLIEHVRRSIPTRRSSQCQAGLQNNSRGPRPLELWLPLLCRSSGTSCWLQLSGLSLPGLGPGEVDFRPLRLTTNCATRRPFPLSNRGLPPTLSATFRSCRRSSAR